ncbi:Uncharacterized protein HZ326_9027 [Fusarium oxysporum f. sp. albedinis]|nr:Uncharacterized protein HZ326_9027 [Fusarium oxysporum f. sp. albedinis]
MVPSIFFGLRSRIAENYATPLTYIKQGVSPLQRLDHARYNRSTASVVPEAKPRPLARPHIQNLRLYGDTDIASSLTVPTKTRNAFSMHGLRVSFNLSRVGPHRQPRLQPSSWFIAQCNASSLPSHWQRSRLTVQAVTIAEIFSHPSFWVFLFASSRVTQGFHVAHLNLRSFYSF